MTCANPVYSTASDTYNNETQSNNFDHLKESENKSGHYDIQVLNTFLEHRAVHVHVQRCTFSKLN